MVETAQSGTKCGVGSHCTCSHFFWLLARILTIFDKKIPYFDVFNCFATKQCLGMLKCEASLFFALSESYWISPCLSLALYGSL